MDILDTWLHANLQLKNVYRNAWFMHLEFIKNNRFLSTKYLKYTEMIKMQ